MNDTAPVQGKQQVPNPTQPPVQSSVQPQSQAPTPPAGQVGSVQKEAAPVKAQTEFIKPTEQAPQIDQELKEAGVESVPDIQKPNLTLEDKKAGLGLAKEHTEVPTQPQSSILQASGEDAKKILKTHKSFRDSVRWLALTVLRQLKVQSLKKPR